MSENQPPPGTPEYLEHGAGQPLPAEEPPSGGGSGASRSRRGRRAWWIGGGVVAVLGLGAGAWAAVSFFQQGAQPAEALPASTIAYVSIDLDPSGGQKIDAFRTLNKFPAFKDEVGVNSVDDIRRKVGVSMLDDSGCGDLTYDHDIDPWLGERAAAAAVDLGGDRPDVVAVVQVRDEGKARDAIQALNRCNTQESPAGFVVQDGWAVLAQSQQVADEVADATGHGTLADDAAYQKWTDAVGEAGVLNAYAAPDAGRVLAEQLDGFLSPDLLMGGGSEQMAVPGAYHPATTGDGDTFTRALAGFKGGAATLRFTGDGIELAMAGDGSSPQLAELAGTTGGQLVSKLPDQTAAAAAVSFTPGWLNRRLDDLSGLDGGLGPEGGYGGFSQGTGLRLPEDVETLLGSGVAVAISRDFDFEAAENSADGSGLPIGAVVKGDPSKIEAVLDKLRAKFGDRVFLGSDTSHGLVAIGPSKDYRQGLLAGGSLGADDTFSGVVPDVASASQVFFLDIDALEPQITKAAAGDQDIVDNVTPLRAIGASSRSDGEVARFSVKVSTN